MIHEDPRAPDGAKLCQWCGGPIRQSGIGRSKDYCSRTHKEYAYRDRRDRRLVAEALAAAAPISTTGDSQGPVSPVVETRFSQVAPRIPAPAAPAAKPATDEDFHLAPPAAEPAVDEAMPAAWRAPAPASRRQLGAGPGRRRSSMTGSAMPLPYENGEG